MVSKYTKEAYNFLEMRDAVDKKLGFKQRSAHEFFDKEGVSFSQWHKNKGYPDIDPEGKEKHSSTLWFKDYQLDIDTGTVKENVFMDFWHYQMNNCFLREIRNDSFNTLNISLEEFPIKDKNDWRYKIQKVYNELFSSIADEEGYVEIWLSW